MICLRLLISSRRLASLSWERARLSVACFSMSLISCLWRSVKLFMSLRIWNNGEKNQRPMRKTKDQWEKPKTNEGSHILYITKKLAHQHAQSTTFGLFTATETTERKTNDQWGLSYPLHYKETCTPTCAEYDFWVIHRNWNNGEKNPCPAELLNVTLTYPANCIVLVLVDKNDHWGS